MSNPPLGAGIQRGTPRQFRNLPIFISASAISNSWGLPRGSPVVPLFGVRTMGLADAISGSSPRAHYEWRVMDLLDEITQRETGRLLLSLLPPASPVLVRHSTPDDTKLWGKCNAGTDWKPELPGTPIGYVEINFNPDMPLGCLNRASAAQPHEVLFHELVHAYEYATHGFADPRPLTGDLGKRMETMAEFAAILITDIYISETPNSPLRYYHDVEHRPLPREYATSKGYLDIKDIQKALEWLRDYDPRLVNMIAILTKPSFNPLREWVKKGGLNITPMDWLPVDGRA